MDMSFEDWCTIQNNYLNNEEFVNIFIKNFINLIKKSKVTKNKNKNYELFCNLNKPHNKIKLDILKMVYNFE